MDLANLVRSILAGDLLAARQFASDARRANVAWQRVEQPPGLNDCELSVAAALVELLSARAGSTPPSWTAGVGPVRELLVLDPGLENMPRSFARAKATGPEPLRKRNLIASPDFLDVA
jgi:hypothetical protein